MADTDKIQGPPEWSSGYVPTVLLFKDSELAEPAWAGSDWGRMEAFAATPSSGGGGPGGQTSDSSFTSTILPSQAISSRGGNSDEGYKEWSNGIYVVDGTGGCIEFNVDVPDGGMYNVTVKYCSEDPRTLELSVNGQSAGTVCKPTGASFWEQGAAVEDSINAAFNPGSNALRLDAPSFAPHLISVTVSGL